MKVLYVINSLICGGAESQFTKLVLGVHRQGIPCSVFVFESGGMHQASIAQQGILVFDGGYPSGAWSFKKMLFLIRAFFRLLRFIKQENITVIHSYLPLSNLMSALAGRLMNVDLIVTSRRGLARYHERKFIWKSLDRLASSLSDIVTVNSKSVLDEVIKHDSRNKDKIRLIPNGLDFQAMPKQRLTENTLAIVMVANLIPYKGHEILIRAIADPCLRDHHFMVYFAGEDRGLQKKLEMLAMDLDVRDKLIFLGRSDAVPSLLASMDIFVLPSFTEGCSNALLEAMAAGLPCIASDVGGNAEVLEYGKCGLIFQPGDIRALAKSILFLLEDKELRERFSEVARLSVWQRYSLENMINSNLALYNNQRP